MRVLWVKAPFVLRRHPAILAAVFATALLAALAASSSPFVRASVRSESLRGQVRLLSPLAAGLELHSGGPPSSDVGRRAAAVRFARALPTRARPVLTSMFQAQVSGAGGNGLPVVAMARTGAVAHVTHLSSARGDGVWISAGTAKTTGLRAGESIGLTEFPATNVVRLRVAGVYRGLDGELDNPYWANFVQDIRPVNPDSPLPPAFVLMPEATLVRIAERLRVSVENRFEYPVAARKLTYTAAVRLARKFHARRDEVVAARTPAAQALGCGAAVPCRAGSALDAALRIAADNVAAVAPTIALVSDCGLAIALALTFAVGVFLVRRRADEVAALDARGESPLAFGARAAVESFLVVAVGAACGFGVALLALRLYAAPGAIAGETVWGGAWRAAAAEAGALAAIGVGAAGAFPRARRASTGRLRFLRRLPWEIVALGVAAALAVLVLTGNGGHTHPSLAVFALPVVAAAGASGLVVRAIRFGLARRRAAGASPPVFLALRRIVAARTLLVGVVVAGAVAFGAFAYALTLSRSLERSAAEKALVANGSDVQGYVDPGDVVTKPFPFPVALVETDSLDVSLPDGRPIDLIAGDPKALARTIRWDDGWGRDVRPLLPRLGGGGPSLRALATPGAPAIDVIVDQGARIPVRVVGHAVLPAMSPGTPALLVSRRALARFAARHHIAEPGPGAVGLIWARGSPARIEAAFATSNLAPAYLTRPAHIRENGSVVAAERSFGYVRAIGVASGALALVALLLYLQARQRSQRIASALAERMGLTALGDAAALALEAAFLTALAVVTGGVVAVLAAEPVLSRIDPLPLYAPGTAAVVPWTVLLGVCALATAAGALLGAAAGVIAARSDVAEALRVA